MKASKVCYECLHRLIIQAATLATDDLRLRARAIQKSLDILKADFSLDEISIGVATRIHKVIKEITGNLDPYREMKDAEIAAARALFDNSSFKYGGLKSCVELAALGNAIDFFRPIEVVKKELNASMRFVIDDSEKFAVKLKGASKVLYLGDNAGEVFFDLPLVKFLRQFVPVVYVVKGAAVQNDVTLGDVRQSGLDSDIGDIITTGTATPGIDFTLASSEFKQEFANADLVFAKGMGYYESLSELPAEGRVLHCLKAKCQPVADSIGVPLNSYLTLFR